MMTIVDHIRSTARTRFLVGVDLECTCWPAEDISAPGRDEQEIIEIGLSVLDMHDLALVDQHSILVAPVQHPVLSEFCVSLTSITMEMLAQAKSLPESLGQLQKFLQPYHDDYAWCSWGMFDLHQFQRETLRKGLDLPLPGLLHFNAKTIYSSSHPRLKRRGMKSALAHEGVTLEGTHHRGVDDARNMMRLVISEQLKKNSRKG